MEKYSCFRTQSVNIGVSCGSIPLLTRYLILIHTRDENMRIRNHITSFVLALLLSACATSPTGRSQLSMFPEAEMNKMGIQAYSELKTKQKVSGNAAMNAYARCVANDIIKVLPPKYKNQEWEVNVFEDKSPNAFALPGGKIGVNTGIFKVAETQDQLAAVLGHEIGHVIAQHGNERMSTTFATKLGVQAVQVAAGASGHALGSGVTSALGLGAQYGILMPFSRVHEKEADLIGLNLMAKAGFDPRESIKLWENMQNASKGAPPEFLSTHPSGPNRIRQLAENMPAALATAEDARAAGAHPRCKAPRIK